nr:hypothetical protein [Tanacetum cinerariifolium]
MSFDDLYNNFKIVKQEVKRTFVSSSSSGSPNMAFLSSPGRTNKFSTASIQVSVVSTPVSTVSSHDNTANISDATVYFQIPGNKITINRSDAAGPRNQDNSRKTVIIEDTSSKAMVENDGAGSQITDNSKTMLGFTSYNAIGPPPTGLFAPPSIDLSNSGLEEFQHPKFKGYRPKDRSQITDNSKTGLGFTSYNVVAPPPTVSISAARQSSSRAAAPVSVSRPINTIASKPLGVPQDALKNKNPNNLPLFDDEKINKVSHMTRNISYLTDFKEHDGGYVAFGEGAKGGKITGKGTIRT